MQPGINVEFGRQVKNNAQMHIRSGVQVEVIVIAVFAVEEEIPSGTHGEQIAYPVIVIGLNAISVSVEGITEFEFLISLPRIGLGLYHAKG